MRVLVNLVRAEDQDRADRATELRKTTERQLAAGGKNMLHVVCWTNHPEAFGGA